MKYILTIDPGGESGGGGETGIVLARFDDTTPYTIVDYWAIPAGVKAFRTWLRAHQDTLPEGHLTLCEDFVLWNKIADPSPLRLVGALEFIYPDLILRQAGRRSFITDEQMKTLDAYIPGGHHRDVTESARHGVAYLVKSLNHIPTQQAIFEKD